jgi:hypothetical protein
MTQTLPIPNLIQAHLRSSGEIECLNTYRGMPICYPGNITGLTESSLQIRVHKHQAVCLELHRQTYLKLDGPVIAAQVHEGDIKTQTFLLEHFHFANPLIGKRELIRVNPRSPLPVVLTNPETKKYIASELIDISLNGLGVYGLSVTLADIQSFAEGTLIQARLILPGDEYGREPHHDLEIKGEVINMMPNQEEGRFRLGIQIKPEIKNQAIIAAYVSQRQMEIINEIRRLYQTLVKLS